MKPSDVITMIFTLPEGEKLEASQEMQAWLCVTIASCKLQGIGCVVSVNGTPYRGNQKRINEAYAALTAQLDEAPE